MAQPTASESKLADSTDKPQIGEQSVAITAPTDLPESIIAINALISAMEGHGLIADN